MQQVKIKFNWIRCPNQSYNSKFQSIFTCTVGVRSNVFFFRTWRHTMTCHNYADADWSLLGHVIVTRDVWKKENAWADSFANFYSYHIFSIVLVIGLIPIVPTVTPTFFPGTQKTNQCFICFTFRIIFGLLSKYPVTNY